MAVQKSKVTRSRRNKRRTHDSLSDRALSVDNATGKCIVDITSHRMGFIRVRK